MTKTGHFIFAAALALPLQIQAGDLEAHAACKAYGLLAESTMEGRQAGVPLSTVLELLDKDAAGVEAMRHIITTAYDTPRYHTPNMQRFAAEEHRDRIERECFKIMANR